ncbi:MAG: hypothetical protein A2355_00145 [Spirochaetes bacterium RIFOXYB1_FULL_32_8]|nr:MAG: hypothetical protein A2Y29_07250 [Spirochaetes bacterium GWE2_31_10]OHD75361.1 MAG: hypothetical protein A2355_00145 [Spirochaetes bacterium RIFOXYB1_FULL_32_8]HBD96211.1 hypothetical protein [Spirochaetia bacterium]
MNATINIIGAISINKEIQLFLSNNHCDFEIFDNFELFKNNQPAVKPDLILINCINENDFTLVSAIKSNKKFINTPVICLLSEVNAEVINSIFTSGASDYMVQPFITREFTTKIKIQFHNISENKRIKEELRVSNEIFDQFMKHSPIYVFFKDEKIRAIKLSKNYETMLGRPLSDIIGKTMDDLFPSDLAKSMIEDDKKILQKKEVIYIDEEFNDKYYTTIKFPIIIDNNARFLAGFTIDRTEQRALEQQLIQSQKMEAIGTLVS